MQGTRSRRLAARTVVVLSLLSLAAGCARDVERIRIADDGTVVVSSAAWVVRIDPARSEISARIGGEEGGEIVLARSPGDAGPEDVAHLAVVDGTVRWEHPVRGLSFVASFEEDALEVQVRSAVEQRLEWPVTAAGPRARALIVPESEGLYVPVDDAFWVERFGGECRSLWGGQLPFWGVQTESGTAAFWVGRDLRSRLCWKESPGSRLTLVMRHDFLERDGLPALDLHIGLAPDSPIGPALAYRKWLVSEGRHVPLADKIAMNPQTEKLKGAMHAYLWGDGRTPEAMADLHDLGVERAFLAYDQDPRNEEWLVGAETIAAAGSYGFLIGPYDTLNNIQPPDSADAASSVYDDDLYRTGGVKRKDGSPAGGFRGRGYHLSSEALKRAQRDFLAERVEAATADGANAYFLDVDATGELYEDYDPAHPMTIEQDRRNRLQRMSFISETSRLVLGSESAAGWATPVIQVSHGTLTPKSPLLWEVLRDRELVGGYWPRERPRMHFMEIEAPGDLATLAFDPRYRLPLFEAVFHDSVVATDFWGVPLPKFRDVVARRSLLLLLYNVPSIWHLDRQEIRDHAGLISAINAFFSPLHRMLATEPLTGFEWLTPDRLVQRTHFSDIVTLTANFGSGSWSDPPPMCVVAEWLEEGRRTRYCAPAGPLPGPV